MPIGFGCQECGRLLRVKDELAGKRIKCPHCGCPQPVPREEPIEQEPQPVAQSVSREEALAQVAALAAQDAARNKRARLVLVFVLVGLLYGLASAFGNQNPYYEWFGPGAKSVE